MRFGHCREDCCVALCTRVCFGAEVGSWFGTANTDDIAEVVAVHMAQTEMVDLVDRKVWVEAVEAGYRIV